MRCMTVLLSLVSCIPAYAQPNPRGFVPGHVFFTMCRGENCGKEWIVELDPETGKTWMLASTDDGLHLGTGLRFTPDGKGLRVLNGNDDVMDFDSMGNGTVVYDKSHGLRDPGGGNGLAWDQAGDFYVANSAFVGILKFPAGYGRRFQATCAAVPATSRSSIRSRLRLR